MSLREAAAEANKVVKAAPQWVLDQARDLPCMWGLGFPGIRARNSGSHCAGLLNKDCCTLGLFQSAPTCGNCLVLGCGSRGPEFHSSRQVGQ